MGCIFCKIVNNEIPANIIYADDEVIAFDDIEPQAPIHKLIIPRSHIATTNDLKDNHKALLGHMTLVATTLARDYDIAEDGYRIVINCNKGGGQLVYHIHMHLIGGRGMKWPPG